jgi:hypothetical protein
MKVQGTATVKGQKNFLIRAQHDDTKVGLRNCRLEHALLDGHYFFGNDLIL